MREIATNSRDLLLYLNGLPCPFRKIAINRLITPNTEGKCCGLPLRAKALPAGNVSASVRKLIDNIRL